MNRTKKNGESGIGMVEVMTLLLLAAALTLAGVQSSRDLFSTQNLASELQVWNKIQGQLSLRIRSEAILRESIASTRELAACASNKITNQPNCDSTDPRIEYPIRLSSQNESKPMSDAILFDKNGQPCQPGAATDCAVEARLWFRALCNNGQESCHHASAIVFGFSIDAANPHERIPGLPARDHVIIESWDNRPPHSTETSNENPRRETALSTAKAALELARLRVENRIEQHLKSKAFLSYNYKSNQKLEKCLASISTADCPQKESPEELLLKDNFENPVAGEDAAYDSDGHPCRSLGQQSSCPIRARVLFWAEYESGAISSRTAEAIRFAVHVRKTL